MTSEQVRLVAQFIDALDAKLTRYVPIARQRLQITQWAQLTLTLLLEPTMVPGTLQDFRAAMAFRGAGSATSYTKKQPGSEGV